MNSHIIIIIIYVVVKKRSKYDSKSIKLFTGNIVVYNKSVQNRVHYRLTLLFYFKCFIIIIILIIFIVVNKCSQMSSTEAKLFIGNIVVYNKSVQNWVHYSLTS